VEGLAESRRSNNDFQFFVDQVSAFLQSGQPINPQTRALYQHQVNERKAWIQALGAGHNPFDNNTLKALLNE
jgi:hypothetical protein